MEDASFLYCRLLVKHGNIDVDQSQSNPVHSEIGEVNKSFALACSHRMQRRKISVATLMHYVATLMHLRFTFQTTFVSQLVHRWLVLNLKRVSNQINRFSGASLLPITSIVGYKRG